MSKLILSLDGKTLKEYPLDKERILIGRKPGNDIQIDNVAVSGEHAVVITILNDSFLEDMGSTNGTKVNGNAVKKCFLQKSDVIEIGKYKLTYIREDAPRPAPDFDKTVMVRPAAPPPRPAMPAPAAIPAMLPSSVSIQSDAPPEKTLPPPQIRQGMAAIQLLTGPSAGRELDLVKNLTTLGKPGVQVAVITRRPQGYFITHVDGAKPPALNGRVLDLQPHPLRDHDIVELLGIKMEFFLK
ncbi:MAG: FHA domain-containing protein [Burkholderiales bacterium]|nr:FHA domain-containing protein [Burkholderiales bacterium]